MIREPSFRTPDALLTCLLALSLRTTPIGVFPEYFSFSHYLATSCCLYMKRLSKFIKVCTKFSFKQAQFLLSKCILVSSWAANQYSEFVHIFSKSLKNSARSKCLRLVNLLSGILLLSFFLHYKVKKYQNMTKEPSFGTPRRFLTCLLTLILRTTPVGVLKDYFSFSHGLATSCYLYMRRLISLKSALNFQSKKLIFSVCCAANQYSEIAYIFSKVLKNSAALRVKVSKRTFRNVFFVIIFALENEKE